MVTLENDLLRIAVQPKGAELTSIFDKIAGIEHLWQADPSVWPWHAPNLFPVVGGLLNNQLLIDGNPYPMERHGFGRHSVFEITESTGTHAVFSLRSNDTTYAVYPYKFLFQIIYELSGSSLSVTYRILNEDNKTMFFSVGAHPAFAVPFQAGDTYEDYYLEFDKPEALATHMLSSGGYFTGDVKSVPTESGNRLRLTKHLFDQDALVFKNLSSQRVSIRSDKHAQAVTVAFSGFPYLGVWAKPGASFVCIEPWLGCADSEGPQLPIEKKEAIQHVEQDSVFEATFVISIG
ncbi:aldose 1-epimerase family protein [Spirosoma knui]